MTSLLRSKSLSIHSDLISSLGNSAATTLAWLDDDFFLLKPMGSSALLCHPSHCGACRLYLAVHLGSPALPAFLTRLLASLLPLDVVFSAFSPRLLLVLLIKFSVPCLWTALHQYQIKYANPAVGFQFCQWTPKSLQV